MQFSDIESFHTVLLLSPLSMSGMFSLSQIEFPFLKISYLFIYGCPGSSSLCWAFSRCSEQGLHFVVVHGLLIAVASPVAEHGL